jgi:hypothetical protein
MGNDTNDKVTRVNCEFSWEASCLVERKCSAFSQLS